MRASGILMPIFSLPGKYGIGSFSKEAYQFVNFLKDAGQLYWQILPVGPTSYGDSPYQSFSTFAGNPYFISLGTLVDEGLLTEEECAPLDEDVNPTDIDYARLYHTRYAVLRKAYDRSHIQEGAEFKAFVMDNAAWLKDYALFMALKDAHDGKSFYQWEKPLRRRKKKALKEARRQYDREIGFYEFLQYEFFRQWDALKTYANQQGICIIGDIPIYVAADSADVWANPQLFQMDDKGRPKAVAGCPPDVFSSTGQLWGNPLYNWKQHRRSDYKWWISRLASCLKLYDVIRIDHFRGFDEYWAIPAEDETAEFGKWEKGPGMDLFDAAERKLGKMHIIAEDLGLMTDSVRKLVKDSGFPNMKVIGFAWDGRGPEDAGKATNEYLPIHYDKNCVVYTGTHDNETLAGWLQDSATAPQIDEIARYTDTDPEDVDAMTDGLIRIAQSSVADTCIIPLQDYLHLDNTARINFPSTIGTNWRWRLKPGMLTEELATEIRQMTILYGRR